MIIGFIGEFMYTQKQENRRLKMTKVGVKVSNSLSEQILNNKSRISKKKDFDINIAQLVYSGIERILEKDEFDLFATKSIGLYDRKIKLTAKKIDKLIKLNTGGKDQARELSSKLKKLKGANAKKLSAIKEKLI
jgi:hypothetical protein